MAGNSRLVGGPEDGTEVDVAWPPAPILNRAHDGKILSYELQDDLTSDGRMHWKHVDTFDVVEPGSRKDTADPNDGERDDSPPDVPRPSHAKRGGRTRG
jgi:hypothetical protein